MAGGEEDAPQAAGGAQRRARAATPPPPESPLWLPALSRASPEPGQLAGGAAAASAARAGTLPRSKDLRASTASPSGGGGGDGARPGLYDAATLACQGLPLPLLGAPPPPLPGHAAATEARADGARSCSPLPAIEPLAGRAGSAAGDAAPAGARSPPPGAARASSRSLRPDPDRVAGVATGADVVAFFGRHGQDSPTKFFYCARWGSAGGVPAQRRASMRMHAAAAATASRMRALTPHDRAPCMRAACMRMHAPRPPEGPRFRPYDLAVIGREDAREDYFTVSATGVVRISRGAQVCAAALGRGGAGAYARAAPLTSSCMSVTGSVQRAPLTHLCAPAHRGAAAALPGRVHAAGAVGARGGAV
jgi:dynein heavy chain